jgi:hypothetical protein
MPITGGFSIAMFDYWRVSPLPTSNWKPADCDSLDPYLFTITGGK